MAYKRAVSEADRESFLKLQLDAMAHEYARDKFNHAVDVLIALVALVLAIWNAKVSDEEEGVDVVQMVALSLAAVYKVVSVLVMCCDFETSVRRRQVIREKLVNQDFADILREPHLLDVQAAWHHAVGASRENNTPLRRMANTSCAYKLLSGYWCLYCCGCCCRQCCGDCTRQRAIDPFKDARETYVSALAAVRSVGVVGDGASAGRERQHHPEPNANVDSHRSIEIRRSGGGADARLGSDRRE